jgi:hypothetical protein
MCANLAGGYCTAACELGCTASCVPTPSTGALCMKHCDADAQCRVDEGYVCDAKWHACLLPNLASIVPASCPPRPAAATRDPAFGASERWSGALEAGPFEVDPSAAIADDGSLQVAARASLTRDRRGTLYKVSLGDNAVELARSADHGTTWSEPIAVSEPGDCGDDARDCFQRPIAVAGATILYVLYATPRAGLRVRASRDGGKTFGAPVTALGGTYGNATVGSDGALRVVMISGGELGGFGSAQHAIEYAASTDGGATFSAPSRVSAVDETLPFYFGNPSIAFDAQRKLVYVAYVRGGRDAKWDIVLAVSRDNGATWKRRTIVSDGCSLHMMPNLALDPTTGTLHVAYYDTEALPGRFVHATCPAGAATCKVAGAINSVPFSSLSTVRVDRAAIGDHASLAIDAKRRRLHAYWAQPVDEAGVNVARIFHSVAKLK